MPRPRKWRKVCQVPERTSFGPIGPGKPSSIVVRMTVEEYEAIRLIDYEGMTQEECAKNMGVARTTVQRIYNIARKKLSDVLVNGDTIHIEGGDYRVCDGIPSSNCVAGHCVRHRGGRGMNNWQR